MEAMSYGMACIINNFGVPFKKGSYYLMPDNRPETIAKSITHLVNNNVLYENIRNEAKNEIEKNFSVTSFADKYSLIYNKLIAKNNFISNIINQEINNL
jgi:glycosyltransferase involved in cell wall biosynthesis